MKTRISAVALMAGALWMAAPAVAAVLLKDQAQLTEALRNSPPCCVVDGRAESSRRQQPLPDALPYKLDLKIIPTAAVVVLADDDRKAMQIGNAIARKHPGKTILAVKGGLHTWQATVTALAGGPPDGGELKFVIPKNTCESGVPLQELRRDGK